MLLTDGVPERQKSVAEALRLPVQLLGLRLPIQWVGMRLPVQWVEVEEFYHRVSLPELPLREAAQDTQGGL